MRCVSKMYWSDWSPRWLATDDSMALAVKAKPVSSKAAWVGVVSKGIFKHTGRQGLWCT